MTTATATNETRMLPAQSREQSTYRTKTGLLVTSSLTDAEVLKTLKDSEDSFALSLVAAFHEERRYGPNAGMKMGWTESQRAWAHLLAIRARGD